MKETEAWRKPQEAARLVFSLENHSDFKRSLCGAQSVSEGLAVELCMILLKG